MGKKDHGTFLHTRIRATAPRRAAIPVTGSNGDFVGAGVGTELAVTVTAAAGVAPGDTTRGRVFLSMKRVPSAVTLEVTE